MTNIVSDIVLQLSFYAVFFVFLFVLGALLGEVAEYLAKLFGFGDYDSLDLTDFEGRLKNGETLSAENIFGNK